MLKPAAFWDTSALVPLCVRQAASERSNGFFSAYRVTVWWAAPVEMASAFVRLLRREEISSLGYAQALQQLEGIAGLWDVVVPSKKVADEARALLERYPLRAAYALQLGAAMVWCEGKPKDRVFLAFDRRLREAASLAGFALE
ncbi:MAG: type II toxin-antitoxin system VapC family toxin [Acidobacteriota bacterium]